MTGRGLKVGIWAIGLAIGLGACSVDPVPEPPTAKPTVSGPVNGDLCTACAGTLPISAGPGATKDATSVWVVNLDRTDAPVTAPVSPDGSFVIVVPGFIGDEIRLQARDGDARSEPIDLVLAEGAPLAAAPRPFASCFSVVAESGFGSALGQPNSRVLDLSHTCSQQLSIGFIGLRAPSTAFSVQAPATPLALDANQTLSVSIDFSQDPSLLEEVLLIEITAPSKDRRAVTLYGAGP